MHALFAVAGVPAGVPAGAEAPPPQRTGALTPGAVAHFAGKRWRPRQSGSKTGGGAASRPCPPNHRRPAPWTTLPAHAVRTGCARGLERPEPRPRPRARGAHAPLRVRRARPTRRDASSAAPWRFEGAGAAVWSGSSGSGDLCSLGGQGPEWPSGTLVAEPAEQAARPLRAAPRGCSGAFGTVLRPGCSGSSSGLTRELTKGMPPSAGAPRKGGASREARTELKPTCPAPRFFPRGTSEHSFCCRGDAAQGAVFPLGSSSPPRERARRQPRGRQRLWAPPGCRRRLRPPAGARSAGHGAESDPELCRLHAVSTRARLRTSVPSSGGKTQFTESKKRSPGKRRVWEGLKLLIFREFS